MITVAYQPPTSGIPVGRITHRVLTGKGLSQKEAALLAGGIHYEAALSRGMAALGPLDLHAVMCWPLPVIFKLFRALLTAKLAQWETEAVERKHA